MAKATHTGECQWCGRRQKLPGGALAKHGYELRNGFMSGICHGSGALPYEVSCDLIEESIAVAERTIAHHRDTAAKLRARGPKADDLLAYHKRYHPELSSRSRGAVHLWCEVELFADEKGRICWRERRFGKPASEPLHRYGNIASIAAELRRTYADSLEREAASLAEYAARQRQRIAEWAPRELQAV